MTTTIDNRQELVNISDRLLRSDVSFEESQTMYKEWSDKGTYDKNLSNTDEYAALNMMKKSAEQFFTDKNNQLILDVGAGTGLSGLMLRQLGFNNLHALEPLKEFADEAQTKGFYSKILTESIGFGGQTSANNDTYDGIVSCGAFGPGHIPCDALNEMVRIVKPGGFVIVCMREEYIRTVPEYQDRLEPLMRQLEGAGRWEQVLRKQYPRHFLDKDGLLYVFRVC